MSHLERAPSTSACAPVWAACLLQVCKKTGAEAKAAELAKMRAFKAELDAQIDDKQVGEGQSSEDQGKASFLRRPPSPMWDAAARAQCSPAGATSVQSWQRCTCCCCRPLQARRNASSMSETERKLNAKLLREAEAAAAGGTIRAFRSP